MAAVNQGFRNQVPVKKTTYRLPQRLREDMFNCLQEEGYNIKQKSRWIREALDAYLKEDREKGFIRVGLADKIDQNSAVDVVLLDDILQARIDEAVMIIRRQTPMMEGIRSAVIRAAIRRRIRLASATDD
jgi:O-methyltransferase involved in polyketide biosynthesis